MKDFLLKLLLAVTKASATSFDELSNKLKDAFAQILPQKSEFEW